MLKYRHHIQAFILGTLLPALYGCQGGGGGSADASASSSGFLFGSNAFGGGDETGNIPPSMPDSFVNTDTQEVLTTLAGTSDSDLALIHNPEPATMILLGGGIMAMAYTRYRKNITPLRK